MEFLQELKGWRHEGRSLVLDGGWEGKVVLTPAFEGVVQVRLWRGMPWSQERIEPSLTVDPARWPELPPAAVYEFPAYLLVSLAGVTVKVDRQPLRLEFWAGESGVAAGGWSAGASGRATGSPGLSGGGTAGDWTETAHAAISAAAGVSAGGAPADGNDSEGGALENETPAMGLPAGAPLLADAAEGGLWYETPQVGVRFQLHPDDHFYGLGTPSQRRGLLPLDQRATRHDVWHSHIPSPHRGVLPVLISHRGYGLFIDNPWLAEWDLGTDGKSFGYTARGGQLVYYFMAGPKLTDVLDRYTRLAGRPSLAPLWAFGLMQSKFGYRNRAELEALVDTFEAKQIPVDTVILDLYWFRKMGDLCWNRSAFPEPEEMLAALRARGIRVIVIEEPYLVRGSRLFPEAERLGLLGKRLDGSAYTFPFWAGEAGLVDFTQDLTRQWWADQHKPLMDMGIAGWWTDLNEPEEHPADMLFAGGLAMGNHNNYALQMLKSLALAQQQHNPRGRLLILSRAGWPGTQALGAGQWSGDVHCTWDVFANQIPVGLSMAMSGMPYWNTDIGGFTGPAATPELYARWMQFGAFTAVMRPHGANGEREPWAFGPEVEAIVTRYIRLRYRLLPYTYTTAREAYTHGLPFMRPLVLHYPDDAATVGLGDQFLWGRDILVAPVVTEGATSRKVYLPEGTWYDFWTNRPISGGRYVTARAPLETMPLYVRSGAILPLAPERERTGGAWDQLTLAVYPGTAESSYTLYEDDGETTAFVQGEFATTTFTCASGADGLKVTIGETEGSFNGQVLRRSYELAVRLPKRPSAVSWAEAGGDLAPRRSQESLSKSPSGWWYDQKQRVLHVKLGALSGGASIHIA